MIVEYTGSSLDGPCTARSGTPCSGDPRPRRAISRVGMRCARLEDHQTQVQMQTLSKGLIGFSLLSDRSPWDLDWNSGRRSCNRKPASRREGPRVLCGRYTATGNSESCRQAVPIYRGRKRDGLLSTAGQDEGVAPDWTRQPGRGVSPLCIRGAGSDGRQRVRTPARALLSCTTYLPEVADRAASWAQVLGVGPNISLDASMRAFLEEINIGGQTSNAGGPPRCGRTSSDLLTTPRR